jgi:hypothetical protein
LTVKGTKPKPLTNVGIEVGYFKVDPGNTKDGSQIETSKNDSSSVDGAETPTDGYKTVGSTTEKEEQLQGGRGRLHAVLARRKHVGKSGLRGVLGPVLTTSVIGEVAVGANSGGIYQNFFGHVLFAAATDYTALASLYDVCRLVAITLRYEPLGENSTPLQAAFNASVAPPVHVPLLCAYNPEAFGATTYAAMSNSKDYNETKHTLVANTSRPWRKRFAIDTRKLTVSGTTTAGPSIGQWMNCLLTSSLVAGGIQMTAYPTSVNSSNCQWGRVLWNAEYQWQSRE